MSPPLVKAEGKGHSVGVMESLIAWMILTFGWLLPLLHVALSPRGGSWRAQTNVRCPFSPRLGWLVLVMLAGPLGWLLFMKARRRPAGVRS
ncbi:hypothetical protein ACFOW6_16540 [Fodinicurvata halophila]|uniref:Cardiolipin synthase N-terminal domain-containing protein n=1 Tax=Fodinicurvata halophila TaxID=1419723 RepID=A0ABV8UQG9_9PROT